MTQTQRAVLDAALGRVRRIDLDEHVLLQLGEPLVGPRLFAAAFVFDQTAGGEDQRELLGDALVDRGLLHVEADVRHPELPRVRQRRILGDQIGPRRVDRLAVHRDGIRQAERVGARLAVAVRHAAVLDRDALDAAGQIDRPGHRIRRGRVDLVDHRQFGFGQVLVPAELLQHAERELRIAVLDLGVLGVVAVAEQADLALACRPAAFPRAPVRSARRNVPPPSLTDRLVL